MDLSMRIGILIEAVELAQKNGVLTLNDAAYAKQAIEVINNGQNVSGGLNVLKSIVEIGQKKGVYTLKDAHMIYEATLDDVVPTAVPQENTPDAAKNK